MTIKLSNKKYKSSKNLDQCLTVFFGAIQLILFILAISYQSFFLLAVVAVMLLFDVVGELKTINKTYEVEK